MTHLSAGSQRFSSKFLFLRLIYSEIQTGMYVCRVCSHKRKLPEWKHEVSVNGIVIIFL